MNPLQLWVLQRQSPFLSLARISLSLNTQLNVWMRAPIKYFLWKILCCPCFPRLWRGLRPCFPTGPQVLFMQPEARSTAVVCVSLRTSIPQGLSEELGPQHNTVLLQALASELKIPSLHRPREVLLRGSISESFREDGMTCCLPCPDKEFLQLPPCLPSPYM